MKKALYGIAVVILVLIGFLFVGCEIDDESENQNQSAMVETSTEIDENATESSVESVENMVPNLEIFNPERSLINSLYKYLEWQNIEFEAPDSSLERRLSKIDIGGYTPVLVDYNPDDIYYVGAYLACVHDSEKEEFCCKKEYTWLGFYGKEGILEEYDGKDLIVAFQINRSGKSKSIVEAFDAPCFESIRKYDPIFVNGMNTADSERSGGTYIYVCSKTERDKDRIYVFSEYLALFYVIPCVELDDKTYITIYIGWEETADEKRTEEVLSKELGVYYDTLRDMIIIDKYSKVNHWGKNEKYALIDIEKFADYILKMKNKD